MKKILILMSIIILIVIQQKQEQNIIIPKESIRIRIIANSNNLEDQLTKIKLKNNIETKIYQDLEKTKSIEDARTIINKEMNEIGNIVNKTLNNDSYDINYGLNYFPEKKYKGIKYDEGYYESLVIKIGEGIGDNWWCVLFPPLCTIETKNDKKNKVEYKSKVLEILKEYK